MENTADFLDALRVKLNLTTDNALALRLGIRPQQLNHYRKLHGTFNEEWCLKIADILETDPAYIIACMHHQREKNEAVKKVWERLARGVAGIAAVLAVMAILPFVNLPDSGLVRVAEAQVQFDQTIHYAQLAVALIVFIIIGLLGFPKAKDDDSECR